jgi:hypothetical protein
MVRITLAAVLACKFQQNFNKSFGYSNICLVAVSALAVTPNVAGAKSVGLGDGSQYEALPKLSFENYI